MGHLFFVNESFEFSEVPEEQRDIKFSNFCKAIDLSKSDKDGLHAIETIYSKKYSYGTLFFDLFLKSWPDINRDPNLRGISNTTHKLFESLLYSVPGMVNIIESHDLFLNTYGTGHFGNTGLEMNGANQPYVSCEPSWWAWKCGWYSANQKLINWENKEGEFLINKKLSDQLLLAEIIKHKKEDKLSKHNNDIGLAFHEEVMRHKGNDLEAYTIEIGKKIAKMNYYSYDSDLSKNEQQKAKGSLRNIFSIISSNGDLQYISLDHLHGMFEFHNAKGEHLGEYKFDGSFNSKAEASHNLKTL